MEDRRIRHQMSSRASLLAAAVLLTIGIAANSAAVAAESCESKPIVAKIHADWCSTCKAMSSVWTRIEGDLGDQATIVEFDVTDRVAYQQSRSQAELLGITKFFDEYRSRTGAIAVLDCKSREPVTVLFGERDFGKYRKAVAKAGHSS